MVAKIDDELALIDGHSRELPAFGSGGTDTRAFTAFEHGETRISAVVSEPARIEAVIRGGGLRAVR